MKLYYSPVSSYSQKVLMAFAEKAVPFTPAIVNMADPASRADYQKLNPFGKVPFLMLDDGWKIPESSIIIEYLDTHHDTGTRLIPEDKDAARQARFFDRLFDLYLNDPMQTIFFDGRKPPEDREPKRVAKAKQTLDTMYGLLNQAMEKKTWALGDTFSMADCAAAPCLSYLRMVRPFGDHPHVTSYANRLAERPSWQQVWTEVKPHVARFAG